jgi:hypothetical protein
MNAVDRWLAAAVADVRARGIEGAVSVLEGFARAMHVLRDADWNDDAANGDGGRDASQRPVGPDR